MSRTRKQKLSVTQDDFRKIIGDEWVFFQKKIVDNCLCHNCDSEHDSTIVNYKVEINNLDDTILHGKCAKCGSPVNRYLETGENEKQTKAIEEIRRRYAKINKKNSQPAALAGKTPSPALLL